MRLTPKRDPTSRPDRWVALSLSGLILPGLGQVYWGERKKGWFLILATLGTLIFTLAKFMMGILQVAQRRDYPRPPRLDILKTFSEAFSAEKTAILAGLLILILLWMGSLADLWRRGISPKEGSR